MTFNLRFPDNQKKTSLFMHMHKLLYQNSFYLYVCLFVCSFSLFVCLLFACLFICFQRLPSVTVVSSGVRAIGNMMFNVIDNHFEICLEFDSKFRCCRDYKAAKTDCLLFYLYRK